MVVMQGFFDASENGDYLVVAGYLFRKKYLSSFDSAWSRMLRNHGLDHFHMTDCNAGAAQFANMDKDRRIACQTLAIRAITEYAAAGVTSAVKLSVFREIMGKDGFMSNPFSMAVHGAMMMCKLWADENDPQARINYIFEAGDEFQGDANHILSAIGEDATRCRFFYNNGHSFLGKKQAFGIQAADILAWQSAKQYEREQRGILNLRGDFDELVSKVPTRRILHDREFIDNIKANAARHVPYEGGEAVAGLAMRMNKANSKLITAEIRKQLAPKALAHFMRMADVR